MPFTESMIYRAAKQAADIVLKKATVENDECLGAYDKLFSGYSHVGPLKQKCFVVSPGGAMSDVEMMKCEHCEMWNPINTVCSCKWLPPSSLAKKEDDEPAYEAELVVPEQTTMVPCPCLRVISAEKRKAYGSKFHCSICEGKLVIPKER